MSLKVWLPLNGNLENRGISNVNVTLASGNTWAASGKIGNKSLTLTKLQTILPTSSCMSGAKQISYCYWVKVNTTWSNNWLDGIRWIETNGNTTGTARQEFYTNCTLIGTWYRGGSISGKSFTPGVWTHLAATIDYNTGEAKFYINGILKGSTNNVDTTYYCRGDFYIGDNGVDISENDVRIYDHCLSTAEVKEISQGLVLHYKLDDQNINNNIHNNIVKQARYSQTSTSGSTWGAHRYWSTRVELPNAPIPWKQGTEFRLEYDTSLGSGGGGSCSIGRFTTEPSTTYCYSLYIQAPDDIAYIHANWLYRYEYPGTIDESQGTRIIEQGVAARARIISLGDHWYRVWGTFTTKENTHSTTFSFYTYPGKTITYYIACPQVELGDTLNNWNNGNFTGNIIQDSSGYGHNGNIVGATIINDSPRYTSYISCSGTTVDSSSNTITGAQFFYCNMNMPAMNAITVTWWGKNIQYGRGGIFETSSSIQTDTTKGSDHGYTAIANWDSTFRIYNGSSSVNFFSNFNKDGNWHYHSITFDGANGKYYCDGILKQTGALTGTLPTWKSFCMGLGKAGGAWRQIKEYVSDLRIYCTALSAADIKQLYEIGAKVDNKQNLHTFEIIEDTTKQHSSITKKGQIIEKEIIENNNTKIYSNGIVETAEIIEF